MRPASPFSVILAIATIAGGSAAPAKDSTLPARASVRLLAPAAAAPGDPSRVPPSVAGETCSLQVWTHTDFDFVMGSFTTQAGFQEGEIAAASYAVPAADFPLRVDLLEMLFAQNNATETTTTQWSALVWRGSPATGTLLAVFSSGSGGIPHLVLPAGTVGAIVRVALDPGAPLVVEDDGSHTFSVGYRIDRHNSPPADPCMSSPPASRNAFPTTDASGLAYPPGNWLHGLDCGPFGCPAYGGWARFSELPQYCRPSGDWVLRAAVRPAFRANEALGPMCRDGLDNDCDGAADCEDADCAADSACTPDDVGVVAARGSPSLEFSNPFTPGGAFRLRIPSPASVQLDLFDVAGRLVARILDQRLEAGTHLVRWDGRAPQGAHLGPGIYFARFRAGRQRAPLRKLLLLGG